MTASTIHIFQPGQCIARLASILAVRFDEIKQTGSLKRWRKYQSFKLGSPQITVVREELRKSVSDANRSNEISIRKEVIDTQSQFYASLSSVERNIFLCRYWYLESAEEIADESGLSVRKIRTVLNRIRKRLDAHLERE